MGGMVLETNMSEILTRIDEQNKLAQQEVSALCAAVFTAAETFTVAQPRLCCCCRCALMFSALHSINLFLVNAIILTCNNNAKEV